MKNIVLAAIPMILMAILNFYIITIIFNGNKEMATGISGIFILAIGGLYDALLKREARRKITAGDIYNIANLQYFGISVYKSLCFGIIFGFVAGAVPTAFMGAILGYFEGKDSMPKIPHFFLSILVLPFMIYLYYRLGKWIGYHTRKKQFLICAFSIFISRIMGVIIAVLFIDKNRPFPGISNMPELNWENIAINATADSAVMIAASLAGCFFGIKKRDKHHILMLLQAIGEQERRIIVDLVRDEILRIYGNR